MPSENESLEEKIPLRVFSEKAYLDYSMYVILDRALPHIADGLKPVQRRIIYAMSELGLKATSKYKKSARTIGDVLGKFHPHGESACYEAMVLMAQPFSFRYPLVDGQGNWGSPDDPKSFAAMRYTEAKLSPYAAILLEELDQDTVAWTNNFDGTLEEPKLLPARVPNILLNGAAGIAVGMATDIPPHNLREVVNACLYLLDTPKASLEDICKHILAPDFETTAEIITPKSEILELYRTGNGSIRQRAVYRVEKEQIIIHALPHQVSGAKVLEQIAAMLQAKKLPMIEDLRDESDHRDPTRFVIELKNQRVDAESLMSHLFATTDLEKSYRVNFNMIGLDGRPQVKNLLTILQEWLEFRTETVKRRFEFRLQKVNDRLHILEGLLLVFLNLDEVLRIIRHEEDPKSELIKRFHLSETQVEAILETKLRHLAKLEEMQIKSEQSKLKEEQAKIEKILSSTQQLKQQVRKELKADAESFGDERNSPLVERSAASAMTEQDIIPNEPITVILSEKGWIRAAKSHDFEVENLTYKAGDALRCVAKGRSNQSIYLFDSTGKVYVQSGHQLPSARGQGEPLTSRLSCPTGAEFIYATFSDNKEHWVLSSNQGNGFVIPSEEFNVKMKTGKLLLKLDEEASALPPVKINDLATDRLVLITTQKRILIFSVSDLPQMTKGKGNRLISLHAKFPADALQTILVLPKKGRLIFEIGKQTVTLSEKDYQPFIAQRSRKGSLLPNRLQRYTKVFVESD